MSEWHKYPEEKPEIEVKDKFIAYEKFLTSDQYGHITIKVWTKQQGEEGYFTTTGHKFVEARNVFYWMELPKSPVANNEKLVKIESLKRKRKELSDQIKQLEQELKGCESK